MSYYKNFSRGQQNDLTLATSILSRQGASSERYVCSKLYDFCEFNEPVCVETLFEFIFYVFWLLPRGGITRNWVYCHIIAHYSVLGVFFLKKKRGKPHYAQHKSVYVFPRNKKTLEAALCLTHWRSLAFLEQKPPEATPCQTHVLLRLI